ncbi:MAG: Zn-dependent exopeptidase M28 [Deltaproteobacteria bacterium]|nr:Zn-dependent exopeptidase M28 [Deltaproteobacteria bacterium]
MKRLPAVLIVIAACGTSSPPPGPTADVSPEAAPDAVAEAVVPDVVAEVATADAPAEFPPFGAACTAEEGCPGGACITDALFAGFAGGYCSGPCDPAEAGACGPAAACFAIEGVPSPPLCARTCASDADCRAPDYTCIGSCVPSAFVRQVPRPGLVDGTETDVAALVAAVDGVRLMARVSVLSGASPWQQAPGGPRTIASRAPGHPDHAVAADFLEAELAALGLAVTRQEWRDGGRDLVNLVAEVPGTDASLAPVVVVAHWDSTGAYEAGWDAAVDPAPGANDNGSGTAIVLEVASLLTAPGAPALRRSVRLVLVDGEEVGLLGSARYADSLGSAGEDLACALNVDMVGAPTEAMGRHVWFITDPGHPDFGGAGFEAVLAFAPAVVPVDSGFGSESASDNRSFRAEGFCAAGMFAWPRQPTNHTSGDVAAGLDPAFFATMAQAAVAVAAAWAGHL